MVVKLDASLRDSGQVHPATNSFYRGGVITRRIVLIGGGVGLALVLLGAAALAGRLVAVPPGVGDPLVDPEAGVRFQHQVAQLFLREAGLSRRTDPVILTDVEINAFLGRHFRAERPGVWPIHVQVRPTGVEIAGQTTLRGLVRHTSFAWTARLLPTRALDLGVWVVVRGVPEAQGGLGRFRVDAATVGRQPVSPELVWRLVGRGPEALTWRAPRVITRIGLEADRIVLYTAR